MSCCSHDEQHQATTCCGPAEKHHPGTRRREIACALSGVLFGAGLLAGTTAAPFVFALAIIAGMWYVLPGAWRSLRRMRADMHVLTTLALAGAVALGDFSEAAALAFLFSLALLLEEWSVGRARRAISGLLHLAPHHAMVWDDSKQDFLERPLAGIAPGALLLVRPGERLPLDGIVEQGTTAVDESAITGEAMPRTRAAGDSVLAGSINQDGAIRVRSTSSAADSTLARIIRLVEEGEKRRAPVQRWIDSFASVYTPVVIALAVLVMIVPPLAMGAAWTEWFYRGLVLLVIACPCALVISTPVSILTALTTAARSGVLIRGGEYLEEAARLRAVAFDKTGTLTNGTPVVRSVRTLNGMTENEALGAMASLEAASTHPIGRAIVAEAGRRMLVYTAAADHRAVPGMGATGTADGRSWWVGSRRFATEKGVVSTAVEAPADGNAVLLAGYGDKLAAELELHDEVRPEAHRALAALRDLHIQHLSLLTGDQRVPSEKVGRALGIGDVRAELLPGEKLDAIRDLVGRHRHVAMVGDGINDAPALSTATLGIAMGMRGAGAASEMAGVSLMTDDLSRIPWLIAHARFCRRIVIQNIALALGIKVVFVALAIMGVTTLWMAVIADIGSTFLVLANSMRLLNQG